MTTEKQKLMSKNFIFDILETLNDLITKEFYSIYRELVHAY